jgi:hypothetical protein
MAEVSCAVMSPGLPKRAGMLINSSLGVRTKSIYCPVGKSEKSYKFPATISEIRYSKGGYTIEGPGE